MYACHCRRMSRARTQRGAVAVEFALIVPLLIALLLAVVTGGVAFSKSVSLNDAVRAGARVGATKAISDPSWAEAVQSATTAASADGLVAANVCVLLVKGPASSLVRASSPSCTLLPVPATPTGLADTDCVVKVWGQRSVPFNALFVNNTVTLKRAAVLRYERTC